MNQIVDNINKESQVRAMLGLAKDDTRLIFRCSAAVSPRVLVDLHGSKWDLVHGCGWVAILPRVAGNLVRYSAPNLSDLVVFYREFDLAKWRKGGSNAQ